jgi:glycosyltransferase involved in cell wall biosynthesis
MLAVCIPVYNQDVSVLIDALFKQVQLQEEQVSIVIIDDASSEEYMAQYAALPETVKVVKLKENIGRSKIRNAFLLHTNEPYLLFLDCDSTLIGDNFINDYIVNLKVNKPLVLFGASEYQKETPRIYYRLRWKYGRKVESKNYNERLLHPHLTFKTNNFLIERQTFEAHPFNEKISGYGHEDTLFGFELEKNNVFIAHIDNPVLNAHLDTNTQFLNKTDEALDNLILIWDLSGQNNELLARLKLLQVYFKYRDSKRLQWVLRNLTKPSRFFLEIGFANMTLFSFYKLCYLASIPAPKTL